LAGMLRAARDSKRSPDTGGLMVQIKWLRGHAASGTCSCGAGRPDDVEASLMRQGCALCIVGRTHSCRPAETYFLMPPCVYRPNAADSPEHWLPRS
jgi:hypothetical protein